MKLNATAIAGLIFGACGIITAAIGVGYGIGQKRKVDDISDRLNKKIDEIAGDVDVDISDAVIDEAVKVAVDREAKSATQKAISSVVSAKKAEMANQITLEIDRQKAAIKDDVTKEVTRQVSRLSINELKESVVEQAKTEAMEKLQTSMDDILQGFTNNLSQVGTIYQTIAQAFSSGNVVKLS